IGRLDFSISGGKIHPLRTLRFGSDIADVPLARTGVVKNLPGSLVRQQPKLNSQPVGNGLCHGRRYSLGLTLGRSAGDQQKVGHIDSGPKGAAWSKLRNNV